MEFARRTHCAESMLSARVSQPPTPIDGVYSRLLVVRDLASGQQLLALPCHSEDEETVKDALEALFKQRGRPLVLKSDNGGGFRGDDVKKYLDCQKVIQLFSPPEWARPTNCWNAPRFSRNLATMEPAKRASGL